MTKHADKTQLRDRFLAVLTKAQKRRRREPIGFMEREQRIMLDAVNDELERRGQRPSLTLGDLQRIKARVAGRADYARKFALYCAERVVDGEGDGVRGSVTVSLSPDDRAMLEWLVGRLGGSYVDQALPLLERLAAGR